MRICDRDEHASFDAAVQRVRDKTLLRREGRRRLGPARFEAITSIPCFEYWILLHFQYTTAAMPRFVDVEARLRAIPALAAYNKGATGLFVRTQALLQVALDHADRANQSALGNGSSNPTTQIPILIRYLQQLAENKVR